MMRICLPARGDMKDEEAVQIFLYKFQCYTHGHCHKEFQSDVWLAFFVCDFKINYNNKYSLHKSWFIKIEAPAVK